MKTTESVLQDNIKDLQGTIQYQDNEIRRFVLLLSEAQIKKTEAQNTIDRFTQDLKLIVNSRK